MSRRRYSSWTPWIVATMLAGSGVGGWQFPQAPVVGPLVSGALKLFVNGDGASPEQAEKLKGLVSGALEAGEKVLGDVRGEAAHPTPTAAPTPPAVTPTATADDVVSIASFNIQVFGTAKLSKTWVADVLAETIRRFDIVAIQEIRTVDDTFLPQFMQMVNARGASYDFVIGPRLGRTSSKEQYAFIYNTARIELFPESAATIVDPKDLLHREPLIARFRTRTAPGITPFSFWLVDVHTDPDEVRSEVDVLAEVFQVVQQQGQGEDDVIMLGDFNADARHLGRIGQLPGITMAIVGQPTNTRGTQSYDNLIFDSYRTTEYTGHSGIVDLAREFHLTEEQALEVSDHRPIWGLFRAAEMPADVPVASRQTWFR